MASTEQIIKAAEELGQLIADHPATRQLEEVLGKLSADTEAQRLLTDYQRAVMAVAEKEAQGRPVEVDDKRKVQELQAKVVRHPLLRQMQKVQMDYTDLMRQVDQAIAGGAPGEPHPAPAPGSSAPGNPGSSSPPPLITPDNLPLQ